MTLIEFILPYMKDYCEENNYVAFFVAFQWEFAMVVRRQKSKEKIKVNHEPFHPSSVLVPR